MARQQTPSSKDNDPGGHVWRVRKVVVLFCFGKGPLDHEIGDVCGRWRIFDDEISHPLSHYDLVNLTS
jgi:hypothetical protein